MRPARPLRLCLLFGPDSVVRAGRSAGACGFDLRLGGVGGSNLERARATDRTAN